MLLLQPHSFSWQIPVPRWKFCPGAEQAVYLSHTLVPALPSCEIFLLPCLPPPLSGFDIPALKGVPQCPNLTRQGTGELSSSVPLQNVARHSLSSPNPSLCPQAGGFCLKPKKLFRYCLTITEFIDCTSLQSSPGMISSCIELSEARNDMSVD